MRTVRRGLARTRRAAHALDGVVVIALLAACASPQPAQPSPAPKRTAAETIASAIVAEATKLQKRTVAVIEFSELRGNIYVASAKGRLLSERITTQLVNTGQVEVVERSQLAKVMRELKLGTTGVVDDATAKSIGKILGVEAIVTGTLTEVGPETEIHSRMVRVEDGVILAAVTTRDVIQLTIRPPEPTFPGPPEPGLAGAERPPSRPERLDRPDRIEESGPYAHYDRLFREGRLAQLNQETRFALEQDGNDFVAHLYQALLQQDSGRPKLAREYLRLAYHGALRLPAPERGIRVIAQTLLRVDRSGMAREVLVRALEARPDLRSAPALQDLLQRLDVR